MSEERTTHNLKSSDVRAADLMAVIYFVKVRNSVAESLGAQSITVADLDNNEKVFQIIGRDLIERCLSADRYYEEKKVTKTQAAELLVSSYNRPLTVVFDKQDGSERTLRGRLIAPEILLGRSKVEDLDVVGDPKERLRLVDHRTIKSLIVDGVKYVVKGK